MVRTGYSVSGFAMARGAAEETIVVERKLSQTRLMNTVAETAFVNRANPATSAIRTALAK